MNFTYLPPILASVANYSDPSPTADQPIFALPRKGSEQWAVPLTLDGDETKWSLTSQGDIVRLPLHSPSGGYNTPEARDVSVIAAAIALGMQLASQFKERFCDVDHPRFSPVAVQLVIGDAVHEFAPGGIGPNSPAMFRFYLGIAFRDKD